MKVSFTNMNFPYEETKEGFLLGDGGGRKELSESVLSFF